MPNAFIETQASNDMNSSSRGGCVASHVTWRLLPHEHSPQLGDEDASADDDGAAHRTGGPRSDPFFWSWYQSLLTTTCQLYVMRLSHDAGVGLVVESKGHKHVVTQVTADGAAERGGLQEGDCLTHYEWIDPVNPLSLDWCDCEGIPQFGPSKNSPISRIDANSCRSVWHSESRKHRRDSTECPYTTERLQELERRVYFHDREKWRACHTEDQWQHRPIPREDFVRSVTLPRDSVDKAVSTKSHEEIARAVASQVTPDAAGDIETSTSEESQEGDEVSTASDAPSHLVARLRCGIEGQDTSSDDTISDCDQRCTDEKASGTKRPRLMHEPGKDQVVSTTLRVHEVSCSTSSTDEDGSSSAPNEDVTCAHTANGGHDRAASDTEGPHFLSTSAECTIRYAIASANSLIDELESLDLTRRFCFLVRCLRFAFGTCYNAVFPGDMSVHGSALKQPELSESGVNRVQKAMRDARDVMATIERDDPENGFDYTLQRLGHAVEAIEEQIQAQLRR